MFYVLFMLFLALQVLPEGPASTAPSMQDLPASSPTKPPSSSPPRPKAASPKAACVTSSEAAVRSKSCPATPGKNRAAAAAPPAAAKSSSTEAQAEKSAKAGEPAKASPAARRAKSSPAAPRDKSKTAAADLAAGPSKHVPRSPRITPSKRTCDMPPPQSTPKRPRGEGEPSPLKPRSLNKVFEAGSFHLVVGGGGEWGGEDVVS